MPAKPYGIELSGDERSKLLKILGSFEESERSKLRAKVLLYSDKSNTERYTTLQLEQLLGTTHTTIQATRSAYKNGGLDAAVYRKARTVEDGTYKFKDEIREKILELYHSAPPEGYKQWSSRLLCSAIVARGIIDHISPASVLKIIKREENLK